MIEMAERMHAALTDALELVLAMLPDGRWERRDGYLVLTAPSFPVPIANSVWVNGPDERHAVTDLESSLEAIRAGGAPPGVLTRDERFPATEAEARRLGLTLVETMPGMVVTPDRRVLREPQDADVRRTADRRRGGRSTSAAGARRMRPGT